jgi:hypothetical protein
MFYTVRFSSDSDSSTLPASPLPPRPSRPKCRPHTLALQRAQQRPPPEKRRSPRTRNLKKSRPDSPSHGVPPRGPGCGWRRSTQNPQSSSASLHATSRNPQPTKSPTPKASSASGGRSLSRSLRSTSPSPVHASAACWKSRARSLCRRGNEDQEEVVAAGSGMLRPIPARRRHMSTRWCSQCRPPRTSSVPPLPTSASKIILVGQY